VREATGAKHVNVLQHLMGFLRNHLSSEDKQELLGLTEGCRRGLLPLVVPLTLLKHNLNRYPVPDWMHQQVFLHSACCAITCRRGVRHCASEALTEDTGVQACETLSFESHPITTWIQSGR
jgi:uncharacterized protein YbgA (DUF1722 family)